MCDTETMRPVLMQAAMSHVELAIVNMSSKAHLLRQMDREMLSGLVRQLAELTSVQATQEDAARATPSFQGHSILRDIEALGGSLGSKCFAPVAFVAAPAPVDISSPANINISAGPRESPQSSRESPLSSSCRQVAGDYAVDGNTLGPDNCEEEDVRPGEDPDPDRQHWVVQLMDIFDQVDARKIGAVEMTDWKRALEAVGLATKMAEDLFKFVDSQGHGTIDRVDWLHMLESVQDGSCPDLIVQFSNALADLHAKNGRIYLKKAPPRYCLVLRPDSMIRIGWDMIMMFLLFYLSLSLPYRLGFEPDTSKQLDDINSALDVFFFLDVILNFRTAYLERDILVLDGWRIARNYMKSWFLLDFLTCIPFEVVTAGILPDLRPAKLMKIGRIIKVVKLLRLAKMTNSLKDSEVLDYLEDKMMNSEYQACAKVAKMIFMISVTCHWMASFMGVAGSNWKQSDGGKLEYSSAIYWAMTTLTTVGYGDIIPVADVERWYATASMVIGGAFYGYIVGMIASTIANEDRNATAYSERMDQVRSWLCYHTELPKTLRRRIKRYFQKHLSQRAATDDIAIINDMSPALVHDVSFFLIHEQVRCNILFHNLPNSAVAELLPILERNESDAGDHIVAYGDPGLAMYIVTEGLASYDTGHQYTHHDSAGVEDHVKTTTEARSTKKVLTIGDSFGEEILLGLEEDYHYSIVATTGLKMFCIGKEPFLHTFRHMPDIKHKMYENFMRNRKPDINRRDEVRGRASVKEGVIPTTFPDAVLDALREIGQTCSATQSKVDELKSASPNAAPYADVSFQMMV